MKARNILVIGFTLAIVVVGLAVFYWRSRATEEVQIPAAISPPRLESDERGPRPTATRLRNGARQIENTSQALASAEKSLARIEQEITSTSDVEKRKLLEHQKMLAEAAIARLKK